LWSTEHIKLPNFNKRFFCIINRNKPTLAALISSYVYTLGDYTLMFEFPEVTISKPETEVEEFDEHFISKNRSQEFNIEVHNAIIKSGGCEYLILGGLDEKQKSYLTFLEEYDLIEIDELEDVDFLLKDRVDKKEYVLCNENDIHYGLYSAAEKNALLRIDENADYIRDESENKEGLIVIEKIQAASAIIAINYALSIGSNIAIIKQPETNMKEIKHLIEKWKEENSINSYNDLSALLYREIEEIHFEKYKFATFFTFGAPYSLILNNVIPFTYVNNLLKPDFFIFNNIFVEKKKSIFSAIIFSPLEFGEDEETNFVIEKIKENNYFVKELVGKEATVFNIENHVKKYPYEILHICSHGGEVDGYRLIEEFKDQDGNIHKVEYDQVFSLAPDKSEELIEVTTINIWRKFDGLDWKSKELQEKELPHYVFSNMITELSASKDKRGDKKLVVRDSSHIKCNHFNYHAVFNIIAGGHTHPLIYNNTCWSWAEISESFLHAGARGYIGTLWAANNNIANDTAKVFYENIFEDSILNALQKSLVKTQKSDDENIYIYWGLHFSKLKRGDTLEESRMNVADRLLYSYYRWKDHIESVRDIKLKEQIERLIRWDFNQLNRYFYTETVKLLTGKKLT